MQIIFQTAINEGKKKGCLCPEKALPHGAENIDLAECCAVSLWFKFWATFYITSLQKKEPFGHQIAKPETKNYALVLLFCQQTPCFYPKGILSPPADLHFYCCPTVMHLP